MNYIISIVIGYLLGSISIGVLLGRSQFKSDIRNKGSGSSGATNVARVFGLNAGLTTLLGDALKTLAALLIGSLLAGEGGVALAAVGCLIGHCWPVYFGFKGGKGVSVGAAISLWIDWRLFLILIATFITVYLLCKIVSVCSIVAAIMFPVASALLGGFSLYYMLLAVFVFMLITFMHRSNIKRLINGTEGKFKPKG